MINPTEIFTSFQRDLGEMTETVSTSPPINEYIRNKETIMVLFHAIAQMTLHYPRS